MRSTFPSQNVENTPLRCRKSAGRCGAKHISKSKCKKHTIPGTLLTYRKIACGCGAKHISKSFGSWHVEKCTRLWREAHFQVKLLKTPHARTTFEGSDVVLRGRLKGFCTLPKMSKTWGFCSISKKQWQAWDTWRGSGKMHFAWQAQYKRHVHQAFKGRALISWEGLHFGASDLQVCWDDFAWQVQHFVWPGTTFAWQAQHFTQMEWKNRKTHWYEAVSSALNFPCLKEISAELLYFDGQLRKRRESHRIPSFLTLSS